MRFFRILGATLLLLALGGQADVRTCVCDLGRPETMAARECSLCRAAEEQPAEPQFFVLRDASPNKPHRWLAMPRFHGKNPQDLAQMTPEQRTAYWSLAIAKARELWGDQWGLAVNNLERRSQCHMHIHIGKLRENAEDDQFTTVASPADIPLPREGDGLWVHAAGAAFHAHWGNGSPELLLER